MHTNEEHIDFALQPLAGPPVSLIGPTRLALDLCETDDGIIEFRETDVETHCTVETGMIVREDRT